LKRPTLTSYNASVVKIYNATNSIVHFLNKNYFPLHEKRLRLLLRNASVVVVNYVEVIGLAHAKP
jgi:hypothetical protein